MFEGLVVSMLDLDIDTRERVPTSCSIPAVLGLKGWKVQDVVQIWTPATLSYEQDWNEKLLERMGGRGICSRIWNCLKDAELTGNSKRPRVHEVTNVSKRLKASPSEFESSLSPVMSQVRSSQKASCSKKPCATTQSNLNASRRHRRFRKDDNNHKITQWLLSSNPSPSQDHLAQQPSTPVQTLPTAAATPETQKKKRRYRRRKRAASNHSQQPPSFQMPSSHADSTPSKASLVLQPSLDPSHSSKMKQASSSVADTSAHSPQDHLRRHSDPLLQSLTPSATKMFQASKAVSQTHGCNVDLEQSSLLAQVSKTQPTTGNRLSNRNPSSRKKKMDSSTLLNEAEEDGQLLLSCLDH